MMNQSLDERNMCQELPRLPVTIPGISPHLHPRALIRKGVRTASKTLSAGQDVYRQGERCSHVFVLLDGWAFRHQVLPDGRRQILDFLLPGSILGLSDRDVSTHGVETLTECSIVMLPRSAIVDLLQADPRSALDLLEQMVENEARTFDHLTSLGRRSARERIAALMVELCSRVRALSLGSASGAITLPLKQAHIADALGLTNEHVCRTLKTMRNDGIMSLHEGQLHVHDVGRLAEEAGIETEEPNKRMIAHGRDWAARHSAKVGSSSFLTRAA
jgi:CRP/FNR family transcriptional regulator